jgi:hypothetical protein
VKKPRDYTARFWSRVEKTDSCWLWRGTVNSNGYGVLRVDCVSGSKGRLIFTHRYAYEQIKGAIPDGLFLDHLCRVRHCCNPNHLEAVTAQINTDRGLRAKRERCIHGHEMSGDNVYLRPDTGGRQCLACKNNNWDQWYEKNKEKISARDKARRLGSL